MHTWVEVREKGADGEREGGEGRATRVRPSVCICERTCAPARSVVYICASAKQGHAYSLVALRPSNVPVHLRDEPGQTIHAATLKQTLLIKSISPGHSILVPVRTVLSLTS